MWKITGITRDPIDIKPAVNSNRVEKDWTSTLVIGISIKSVGEIDITCLE